MLRSQWKIYRLNLYSVILKKTCTCISLKLHQQTPFQTLSMASIGVMFLLVIGAQLLLFSGAQLICEMSMKIGHRSYVFIVGETRYMRRTLYNDNLLLQVEQCSRQRYLTAIRLRQTLDKQGKTTPYNERCLQRLLLVCTKSGLVTYCISYRSYMLER